MSQDIYTRLNIAKNSGLAVYLNNPCTEADIHHFNQQLHTVLGEEGAPWYVRLLRFANGLQIDNSIFESADDFVHANADYRSTDHTFNRYLVFGHSGNVDLYVFDTQRAVQPFCVVNFYGVEDVYEEYESLEALLTAVLDSALR